MFVVCPHCNGTIEIIEMNCRIFRHGVIKATGKQIDPHASKSVCDDLFEKGLIDGCGKPFVITLSGGVEICDYI
jgi:hypothetical protein